jgi:hypothetical protein
MSMPTRHYVISALVLLCLYSAAAPAFGKSKQSPGQQVLPAAFAGWNCAARNSLDLAHPFGSAAGNPAALAAEYGFVSGEQCKYTRGPDSLYAQLYVMKDPTAAYGEFSYLRTPDLPKADFAVHAAMSNARALVLEGNLVLDVTGDLDTLQPELKALLSAVSTHAEEGPLPTLWQHLPPNNEVPRSDHYLLGPAALAQFFPLASGDWLGFSLGAEAEAAHYSINGQDVTLLIADFPTPQIAAAKLTEFQQKFGASANGAAPQIFAKRSVTLVAIVTGARSQAEADTLLSQIETATQITWNEPAFQFNEPSIEMMIVGSIVGAGSICAFALVAGVAFGGVRIVVKRFFPDKVFDRSSHLQVLQLGLNSKPINSDDFYGMSDKVLPGNTVDRHLSDHAALRIFR